MAPQSFAVAVLLSPTAALAALPTPLAVAVLLSPKAANAVLFSPFAVAVFLLPPLTPPFASARHRPFAGDYRGTAPPEI
jgi:hypothetical protein